MPLIPPPEIIAKQDDLQRKIDHGVKELARLQEDIQQWKEDLKSIQATLACVYGESAVTSAPEQKAIPTEKVPTLEPRKRRIPIGEYREIILPFVKLKRVARYKEIRLRVSEIVGFPATDDMTKTAVETLLAEPGTKLVKLGKGLVGYKEEMLSKTQLQTQLQRALMSVTA